MAEALYGFIYLEQNLAIELNYQEGQQVALDSTLAPAEIHHEIATLVINKWPGQLWFVEVLDNLPNVQVKQEADAVSSHHFKLVKQLSTSFLFGAKGEGICLLLDRILELTLREAHSLASLFSPIAAETFATAWNNWLASSSNPSEHRDADHTGTLAIGVGENASPIYSGFLIINDMVYARAKQLEGDSAFISVNHYGSQEFLLNPLWNKTCSVLLQAAMGLGAEQYVPPKELRFLLAGWRFLTQC